jgi:hypothetical protein
LESRHCPSIWEVPLPVVGESPAPGPPDAGSSTVVASPPVITEFSAEPEGLGFYTFSGNVQDANPASCVVTFGGIPSLAGTKVQCDSEGNFSITVLLKTDGSDAGTVTVYATDGNGLQSATDWVDVEPTGGK